MCMLCVGVMNMCVDEYIFDMRGCYRMHVLMNACVDECVLMNVCRICVCFCVHECLYRVANMHRMS